jgi:hypothetical protein
MPVILTQAAVGGTGATFSVVQVGGGGGSASTSLRIAFSAPIVGNLLATQIVSLTDPANSYTTDTGLTLGAVTRIGTGPNTTFEVALSGVTGGAYVFKISHLEVDSTCVGAVAVWGTDASAKYKVVPYPATGPTSALDIIFNGEVPNLSMSDVTIVANTGSASKDTLLPITKLNGATWRVPLRKVFVDGTVTVTVAGYTAIASGNTPAVKAQEPPVGFRAWVDSVTNTNVITLEFTESLSAIAASNIVITAGTGSLVPAFNISATNAFRPTGAGPTYTAATITLTPGVVSGPAIFANGTIGIQIIGATSVSGKPITSDVVYVIVGKP